MSRALKDPVALLAALIDLPQPQVQSALEAVTQSRAYEQFSIPKLGQRSPRTITAPIPSLKEVQRAINILLEPLPLSMAVHGFRRARSIVTGARAHIYARALINIDLKDFFHSVDQARVLRSLSSSLSSRLVTETGDLSPPEAESVIQLIAALSTYPINGRPAPVLPQGAPTSPFLANLAARPLDNRIRKCLEATPGEFTYTRYADDLTISAPHEIDRSLVGELLRTVQRTGFVANPHKVRIASTFKGSPHYRQKLEVTHLIIDTREHRIRVPKARLERFRMFIRQAALAPTLDLKTRQKIEGIVSFLHMVYGTLPASMDTAYRKFCDAHACHRLEPGRSRRRARRQATQSELYR